MGRRGETKRYENISLWDSDVAELILFEGGMMLWVAKGTNETFFFFFLNDL